MSDESRLEVFASNVFWQQFHFKLLAALLNILDRASVGSIWQSNKTQLTSTEEFLNVRRKTSRTIPEDYLTKLQESCVREFELYWKIKVVLPNIDFISLYKLCFFLVYCFSI